MNIILRLHLTYKPYYGVNTQYSFKIIYIDFNALSFKYNTCLYKKNNIKLAS